MVDTHPSEIPIPELITTAPLEIDNPEANAIVTQFSDEAKLKMEVIQSLLEPCDRKTYGERLKEAADKLSKSVRTVQRLVKKWEKDGLAGLTETERTDKGKYRIDEDWQKFIIKTYREGNKGSKRMTPKQVFMQVQATADDLGVKSPSHMTVYRILSPLIEKQEKAKSIRSPGWRGSQLSIKTRAGQEISVEYSNHV